MARITPITAKRVVYKDFQRNLTMDPISFDLARKTNEEAVKEALHNLLLTDKGERPFQPNLGCDIRKMLFENITPSTVNMMKETIEKTIRNYEPRANVIDVDVKASIDLNAVTITIVFNTINTEDNITFRKTLFRVR